MKTRRWNEMTEYEVDAHYELVGAFTAFGRLDSDYSQKFSPLHPDAGIPGLESAPSPSTSP